MEELIALPSEESQLINIEGKRNLKITIRMQQ